MCEALPGGARSVRRRSSYRVGRGGLCWPRRLFLWCAVHRQGSLQGSLSNVAIEWYWALAQMLARAGVDLDDVFDLVDAWMTGNRRVWLRTAVDPATELTSLVIWGRADDGTPLAVFARRVGRDIEVYSAAYLTADQAADFEKWEATRND